MGLIGTTPNAKQKRENKMNKKGSGTAFAIWLLVFVVAFLAVGIGYYTQWFGLVAPQTPAASGGSAPIQPSATGDIASFKISCLNNTASPARFAGTAYCWNSATPTLPKSGGSITTTATAGTAVSGVTRNENVGCACVDNTHYGSIKPYTVTKEADELSIPSLDASATNEIMLYQKGQGATAQTLSVPAGTTATIDKWTYKAKATKAGFNLKEVCFQPLNVTNEISNVVLEGFSPVATPYTLRNTHKYCQALPQAQFISDFSTATFGAIKITTTASMAAVAGGAEVLNMSLIDENLFSSTTLAILTGVQTDTTTPTDVGLANPYVLINISGT